MAEFTPMMRHYLDTKEQYKDCILFYRLGDFYEMFFDDAVTASRELELTLTGKDCGLEERAPMCGVPYHAVETYLNRLVAKGYKVAICEQVEDPKLAKGLVKREVVRVVTPGTNLSTQALDETKEQLPHVYRVSGRSLRGVRWRTCTTGDYFLTEVDPEPESCWMRSIKFSPAEIICNEPLLMSGIDLDDLKDRLGISAFPLDAAGILTMSSAVGQLMEHFQVSYHGGAGPGGLHSGRAGGGRTSAVSSEIPRRAA